VNLTSKLEPAALSREDNRSDDWLIKPARRRFGLWTCWVFALATAVGYSTRFPLSATTPPAIHALPAFAVGFLLIAWALRRPDLFSVATRSLILLLLTLVVVVSFLGGGLGAAFLAILPFVPLVATFLAGVRAGWLTTALSAVRLVVLGSLDRLAVSVPEPPSGPIGSWLRALVLVMACGMITGLIWFYENHVARLRKVLKSTATSDDLTGLANRGSLDDTLALEHHRLSRHPISSLSLVLFGIDHFKSYNDIYGHQAADECLKLISDTARRRVRRVTDLLARYGGDEMLAVLPATSRGEASTLAECIRRDVEVLAMPHTGSPHGVVTVSLGVATAAAEELESVDALLSLADSALARAKEEGRNKVVVSD
jgi:diguanylate cyclase (GGDEF)-like protein